METVVSLNEDDLCGMNVLETFKLLLRLAETDSEFVNGEFIFKGLNGEEFKVTLERL